LPSTSEELSDKELDALQKVFEQVATAAEKEKGKPSYEEMLNIDRQRISTRQ